MASVSLVEKQKVDNLLFINNIIEALVALLLGWGSLAVNLVMEL